MAGVLPFDTPWWLAILLCLVWTLLYVLSLYVWLLPCCPAALRAQLPRAHRTTILKRTAGVTVVTIGIPLLMAFALPQRAEQSGSSSWASSSADPPVPVPMHAALGWSGGLELPVGVFLGALATCALFLGPIVVQILDRMHSRTNNNKEWGTREAESDREKATGLQKMRDLVVRVCMYAYPCVCVCNEGECV
jgi:hypothetical protein